VIAATNRDLEQLTRQEHFRKDLFFRLNTFRIHIPPLRLRPDDVIRMTEHFLASFNKQYQMQRKISPDTILKLQAYKFPGNVRELQNIIKNAVVLSEVDLLDEILADNIGVGRQKPAAAQRSMTDMQYPMRLQDQLERVEAEILSDACVRFRSTRQIAQNLGTSQSSVMRKINKYNLNRNNSNRK